MQAAKIRQKIRNEEIQIDVVERKKLIEIETQEIMRKDCELTAMVKLPAEAESYRVQTIAEGKRTQTLEVARADAERIKKVGAAEALAIELVSQLHIIQNSIILNQHIIQIRLERPKPKG